MIYMNMLYDLSFRWGKNSYFQGREGGEYNEGRLKAGRLWRPEQRCAEIGSEVVC